MKIHYELILRKIEGENILVPVGSAARKFNGLFAMTDVACFIWERLPDAENDEKIVDAVTENFDVDRDTAAADAAEFLGRLRNFGIID